MRISQLINRLKELKKEAGYDMRVVLITEEEGGAFAVDFEPQIDIFDLPSGKKPDEFVQVLALVPHDCGPPDDKPPHLRLVKK